MGHILEISAPSHRNELCKGIGRLLDSEMGCDFEISCADSAPIKAHFFVLQIFCQVLKNSNYRRIEFESTKITREDVRRLLEFVYRGKTRVKVERLDAVKRAAGKLGLEAFLDLVDGKKVEEVGSLENKTDTEIKTEVCQIFSEDKDDYTEYSESDKEQKSNAGKHEENGEIGKHLMSAKRGGNLNPHLAAKHQMDSNGQVLEKSVKCDRCDYTCADEVLLKTHIKNAHCATDKVKLKRPKRSTQSNARDHACETCGKCFQTATILRRHKLAHAEKVDCEVCGRKLSLRSIWRHRMLHEVGGNVKKFKCTICAHRTRWRSSLNLHLRNVHHMSKGKIARIVYSEATRVSDEDPPDDLGKIRRRFKGRKKRVQKTKNLPKQ